MNKSKKLRHGDHFKCLRQTENAGVLFGHKHQILFQFPAPASGVAYLFSQHERCLACPELFLNPPALNIFLKQFGIKPRRFERNGRMGTEQIDDF
ncbi:hypothetical protein [Serratia sp. (in: enterobacteria)]|uniref:hypothetical protein n=1 Tax=Serratia sp. (in: enterobacteria) TaxID=616 RepID=UPI003989CC18